jgi:type 1 fimbria pilin
MKLKLIRSAALAFAAALFVSGASLSAATMTIKGTVADAMCGAKHMMPSDAAKCTRECVKKGSDYALVTSDGKVYTLKADAAAKTKLDERAGKMAEVRGDVNGTTVTVASVK